MTTEYTRADEEIGRLVMAHRPMLMTYLGCLLQNDALIEDAFSDLTLAILHSWDSYDQTRPFHAWARGIARRLASATLRKEARRPRLLEEGVLESVAEQVDDISAEVELEFCKQALRGCMQGLLPRQMALLRFRYFEDRSFVEMAGLVGKSAANLYVIFNRLHKLLLTCIQRELDRL